MAAATPLDDGSTLADHLVVDSAGTGNWHAGEPMDPRAAAALARAGYHDPGHRARAFQAAWFDELDLVVALARTHQQTLVGLARRRAGGGETYRDRLVLLRSFDPRAGGSVDVPDPYYGDDADFVGCVTMVESACRGLVVELAGRVADRVADRVAQSAGVPNVTSDSAS